MRRDARRQLERGWELNMNFLAGNQYCDIGPAGELEEVPPRFYWQDRRVFNHIAPAIDTRCAKLARVRPVMSVRAATGEESDTRTAKIAADVLHSVSEECGLDDAVTRATAWSETCGTAFYKVYWDAAGGKRREDGQPEGAVCIAAVSPFEIYPQDLACERVEDQPSIMHVRAVPVQEIRERYGLNVAGEDIDEFSFTPRAASSNDAGGGGRVACAPCGGAAPRSSNIICARAGRSRTGGSPSSRATGSPIAGISRTSTARTARAPIRSSSSAPSPSRAPFSGAASSTA